MAGMPMIIYSNDGTKSYGPAGGGDYDYFYSNNTFKFVTEKLKEQNITDILGYTNVKDGLDVEYDKNSEETLSILESDMGYIIRQSDFPAVPPQNYKELVQKTADAYRKKSGTTAQVSVGELPDKIRSLKVEGGVPPNGREWKQSNINTGTFTHICCGENGVWVAGSLYRGSVKYYGIYYSLDGRNWTLSNVIGDSINSICYGNGIFVAVGTNMYYSNDGMTWIQNGPSDCLKIEYGNGIWVTGNSEELFYSYDGISWKHAATPGNTVTIYYANNMWIAGVVNQPLLWSHDGINWDSCSLDTIAETFLSIFYNDDYWVTADAERGEIFRSLDGIDWEYAGDAAPTYSIIYENGIWIFATSAGIYFSDDDITTVEPSNVRNEEVYFVNYANGIFIALGQYNIYYSLDGIKWTKSNEVSGKILVSAYLANGIWVAGTGNGLYYSLASFDRSPASMPVEDTSWATASEAKITSMLADAKAGKINLEDYWKVGDTRKITLDNKSYNGNAGSMTTNNEEVELVLAELLSVSTSYGAKNGFIVTTKNCLKTKMMINSNGTNTGSFADSNMCAFLNDGTNGFLGMLPDWLANNLLTVNVKTADPYNGTTIETTQHKIFLPTEREIFGDGYGNEGSGYSNNTEVNLAELKHWKYYQTTSNRVKQVNGSNSYWWERSPSYYFSNMFCIVRSGGDANISDADIPSGVAPCFCIGTPPAKSITASVSTVSGASYGFKKNSNGYFESQNIGLHNTAALCKLTITVIGSYNVSLDCINYAESIFDFGLISTKNSTLTTSNTEDSNVLKSFKGSSQSGVQNVSLGTLKDETATFYIKFRKDSSGNNYNDSLQWKLKADGNIVNI